MGQKINPMSPEFGTVSFSCLNGEEEMIWDDNDYMCAFFYIEYNLAIFDMYTLSIGCVMFIEGLIKLRTPRWNDSQFWVAPIFIM